MGNEAIAGNRDAGTAAGREFGTVHFEFGDGPIAFNLFNWGTQLKIIKTNFCFEDKDFSKVCR